MPWIFMYSDLGPQALTTMLDNAPFVSLPASLPRYKVVFKGKSRKWGGALATIEKKTKSWVYGSIHLLPVDDLKKLDKYYSTFEKITVPIFIEATQDKVKAHTYINKSGELGPPGSEYIKEILKHLKFFWGQGGGSKPKLETFGIEVPEPQEVPNKEKSRKTKRREVTS